MRKVGYSVISKNRNDGKPRKCVSCGKEGNYKVTFQDRWGKLIVTLCKDCAGKDYGELSLQSSLNWPGIA